MKSGEILRRFTAKDGREVILRTPKWEDLDDLVEFITSLGKDEYTRDEGADWLAKRLSLMEKGGELSLVAEVDGKAIATSRLGIMDDKPSIHVGFIEPEVRNDYRNVGIGTEMVKTLIDQARKLSLKLIVLGVYSTNSVALHVYEKVGFKRVGLIPKRFFEDETYIDEAIMAMEL